MKKRILFSALTLLLAFPLLGMQGGTLNIVGKFVTGETELDVATYTQNTEKVALLGISIPKKGSYAARADEWATLIQLWDKASQTESQSWQFIGTLKETQTSDPTLVIITAGPGVRITLETADGIFSYVLPKSDYARFGVSLHQVANYVAN
ncbi:MAG TPA: hypothetical protein VGZ48_09895 [Candidatus Acidoferrales bacterium]|jgi:hypothetical protein|nr:hypothetical protein [Candidatus Acidoferrales bacterium]